MRAALAFDGVDMKHHSGIISELRRRYIKTDIFETRLSEIISVLDHLCPGSSLSWIISVLFDVRTDSDYDDFFVISRNETLEQIQNAAYFLNAIEPYIASKGVVLE